MASACIGADDGADGRARRADENAQPPGDSGAKARKSVAVQRRELRAEVVHEQRRHRFRSGAVGIL